MKQFNQKLQQLTELGKRITDKGIFPQQSLGLLREPKALLQATMNSFIEPFSHHTCKECGIVIKAPRKWAIEHAKWHNTKREMKENELRMTQINPYN